MKQAAASLSEPQPEARSLPGRILKGLFHFGILGAFASAISARFIDPVLLWWPQLFATILPVWSLLLIPGALVAIASRSWRLVGVYGLFVVFALLRMPFGATPAEQQAPLPPNQSLTVLTYNAQQFVGKDKRGKSSDLKQLLEQNNYTLASFQEMGFRWIEDGRNVYDNMLTEVGQEVGMRAYLDEAGIEVTEKQQIMGRAESLHLQEIDISSDQHSRPQKIVRLLFSWQGHEAVLYNIHLQTFGYRKPWDDPAFSVFSLASWRQYIAQFRRAYQLRAREARRIAALIAAEEKPVIVTGDFNSTMHNWSYHTIARGLVDAYGESGQRWGATFPRSYPLFRIDHVLVTRGLRVHSVKILDFKASDHLPLEVQLYWP